MNSIERLTWLVKLVEDIEDITGKSWEEWGTAGAVIQYAMWDLSKLCIEDRLYLQAAIDTGGRSLGCTLPKALELQERKNTERLSGFWA